ncbi:hypothetical protein P3L10_011646 [Capsicum annuum]
MVSSPIASIPNNNNNNNNNNSNSSHGGDNFVLRELIGRLGSICNSREMSPNSHNMYNKNNNNYNNSSSTNNSCYSTPLNSPPKLNLSMMGNLPPTQFTIEIDPGFVERAARFSCFATNLESGQLSIVSSNQSIKILRKAISKGKSTKIANEKNE